MCVPLHVSKSLTHLVFIGIRKLYRHVYTLYTYLVYTPGTCYQGHRDNQASVYRTDTNSKSQELQLYKQKFYQVLSRKMHRNLYGVGGPILL